MRVLKYRKTAKKRLHARHAENSKRMKLRVSKGDTVRVMRGEDKGKEGKVIRVLLKSGRVVIEGVNLVKMHRKAFYERVRREAGLKNVREARFLTIGVFAALKEQLSAGEADDVVAQLPKDLKEVWEDA